MSRKKKVSRRSKKTEPKKSNKIKMDTFSNRRIALGLMKPYEVKPLRVFFQQQNLREEEDLDTYTETLKKY